MKKKAKPKASGKSDVHMMLLGMVAVLAIVGLVLMFNARMATGKIAYIPNPTMERGGDPCLNAPKCPDGSPRSVVQQYMPTNGYYNVECGCPPWPVDPVTVQVPIA